jgi:putative transposase
MPNYRRAFVPGGVGSSRSICWTRANLARRFTYEILREAVARFVKPRIYDRRIRRASRSLHAVLEPAAGDQRLLNALAVDQKSVCESVAETESLDAVRLSRNERGIWQRRFWEHLIRMRRLCRHVEYCYINPLSTVLSHAFRIGRISFTAITRRIFR